jgi:hypothetical protein
MILVAALSTNFRQGRLGMTAAALLLLASQTSLMAEVVYLTIPGAVLVVPGGINNLGFISGTFYPGTLFLSPIGFGPRGFITTVHGQPFYPFDAPGGLPTLPPHATAATFAIGINDFGVVAGYLNLPSPSGFLRSPFGSFSSVVVPGSTATRVWGINDLGEVTGSYESPTTLFPQGFIRDQHGRFISKSYPGAHLTTVYRSNNRGQLVGEYVDTFGRAFLYDRNTSKFTTINVPGAVGASGASGINDEGDIIGSYSPSATETFGFIRDAKGNFYKLLVPYGAPASINDFGEIVGSTVATSTSQGAFYCRWNPRGQVANACPVVAIH